MVFRDRAAAAGELIARLQGYAGRCPLVLAVPRGAVGMGRLIADALGGELDVVLAHKLRAPGQPELAVGAVDETGHVRVSATASAAGADRAYLEREAAFQRDMLARRRRAYAAVRPPVDPAGRIVIVVDDGVATGATMLAALDALRRRGVARLVVAIPVAPAETVAHIRSACDELVCLHAPATFGAIGAFYTSFPQVEDAEALSALARPPAGGELTLTAGAVVLAATLSRPDPAHGLIVFAHGSGSSRHSPRNRHLAADLRAAGFATLLLDLLTEAEEEVDVRTAEYRFDIPRLAERVTGAIDWARRQPGLMALPIGLVGASTGAAAALAAAAVRPESVQAVVSRGGRPDLAGDALRRVRADTLFVVGGDDPQVLALNRDAARLMTHPARIEVVAGATHLFEEPGTLEAVSVLTVRWMQAHLTAAQVGTAADR